MNPRLDAGLVRAGAAPLARRKVFTGLGFLGASLAVAPLVFVAAPPPAVVTFAWTLALGFVSLHPSGFKANYMDVATWSAGFVSGVGNTVASIASLASPLVVDEVLRKSGSWPAVFAIVAAVNLAAAALFAAAASATPVDVADARAD